MSQKHTLISVAILLLTLSGCSSPSDDQTTAESSDTFPANPELAEQNVVLAVRGWKFGGGVVQDMGNGLEIVPMVWWASGVLVDRDGTLVTNYHVAARALEIEASFDAMADRGGATYKVPFIKVYDKANDLAIMQIEGAASFTSALLGDSDAIEPRDGVLAVGNPDNLGLNITEGSISAVQTDRKTGKPFRLVHTAATTGGSSGGSLYKGSQVVGIHHAGLIRGPEFGFAVPINFVKELLANPQYDRQLLLTEIFSQDLKIWGEKTKQVAATTATVPAKPRRDRDGVWSATLSLLPQTDYAIVLQTRADVDLDLTMWDGNTKIGHARARQPKIESLAFSNDNLLNATIAVHSGRSQPVSFGITLYEITW